MKKEINEKINSQKIKLFVVENNQKTGGVGKSTMCVNLAAEFVRKGKKVGILDIDLCGPR